MDVQLEARTSSDDHSNGHQARTTVRGKPTTPRENGAAAKSESWIDQSKLRNGKGFGHFPAAKMMASIDACLSLFNDWRNLATTAADQIEEDMKIIRESWQEFSQCEAPDDYAQTGKALSDKLTKQYAKSTQKMASLAGEFATRRWRASTEFALAPLTADQTKPV